MRTDYNHNKKLTKKGRGSLKGVLEMIDPLRWPHPEYLAEGGVHKNHIPHALACSIDLELVVNGWVKTLSCVTLLYIQMDTTVVIEFNSNAILISRILWSLFMLVYVFIIVDGRKILEWTFKKLVSIRGIGLIRLRIGIIEEPLWMRPSTSGFHKSWR